MYYNGYNYAPSYEDVYMDKLASVQAYGITANEAYAAMNDAAAAYDECMYKAAYAQEAYNNALATMQGAEAMYYENLDKVAYAQDLYADAASRLGYNKTAAEYVPLPETALQATMTQGRLPAVRQGEPGAVATSPAEAYAAAARVAKTAGAADNIAAAIDDIRYGGGVDLGADVDLVRNNGMATTPDFLKSKAIEHGLIRGGEYAGAYGLDHGIDAPNAATTLSDIASDVKAFAAGKAQGAAEALGAHKADAALALGGIGTAAAAPTLGSKLTALGAGLKNKMFGRGIKLPKLR